MALDRFPRTTFALAKSRPVWGAIEKVVRGELADVSTARGLARPGAQGALRARARGRQPGPGLPRGVGSARAPLRFARVQNYHLSTLDGGARVISEPLETVRSVAIGFWIGTGSRDESDTHAGVTHFLEHLLFKGSADSPHSRSPRSSTASAES